MTSYLRTVQAQNTTCGIPCAIPKRWPIALEFAPPVAGRSSCASEIGPAPTSPRQQSDFDHLEARPPWAGQFTRRAFCLDAQIRVCRKGEMLRWRQWRTLPANKAAPWRTASRSSRLGRHSGAGWSIDYGFAGGVCPDRRGKGHAHEDTWICSS